VKTLENVLSSELTFKEHEFQNRVERLRGQLREEVQAGIEQVKANAISEEEFDKVALGVVDDFNVQRKTILAERQQLIDEVLLGYDRQLAATQGEDLHTIKMFREGLKELIDIGAKDKNELLKHYKDSLKLGDELGLRCGAVAGLTLGVNEIVEDFAGRDSNFLKTATERRAFEARFKSTEAKFYDAMGVYRSFTMPKIKRKPVKIAQTAEGKPYFKNRLELK
jgi:hypothetical protein